MVAKCKLQCKIVSLSIDNLIFIDRPTSVLVFVIAILHKLFSYELMTTMNLDIGLTRG